MWQRLKRAVLTWPSLAEWGRCVFIGFIGWALIGGAAFLFGVAHWQPRPDGWPLRLASVMIVPALTEELVFRGLLIPGRGEGRHSVRLIAVGLTAFVLWHVVEATTILPGAQPIFLRPGFLFCAAILGGVCILMRYRSGSLWPAVLFHGLTVFLWQVLLGGPTVADLIRR